jgi:hypothetical protein
LAEKPEKWWKFVSYNIFHPPCMLSIFFILIEPLLCFWTSNIFFLFFYYRGGGGISSRKNFGGQISSLGIPTKFFQTFLRKPTKFFQREICLAKNLRAFGAISFISYVFPYGPRKNPTKFFRDILRKLTKFFQREICPLRNLFAAKIFPPGS